MATSECEWECTGLRRIGIMGGTFDPIHIGHLQTAQEAADAFALDEVIFIPAGTPPHKQGRCMASGEDRYSMVLLATRSNPRFSVSRMELERTGPSFTIDTIRELGSIHPDAGFYFITGTDAISEIFTWKEWQKLLGLCRFVVATRPGWEFEAFLKELADHGPEIRDLARRHVRLLQVPLLEISSTGIRRRCHEGLGSLYLTTEAVAGYIQASGLYRNQGNAPATAVE